MFVNFEDNVFTAYVSDNLFYWMVSVIAECYAEDCEDTGFYYFDVFTWDRRSQENALECMHDAEAQDEWERLYRLFNSAHHKWGGVESIRIEPEHPEFEWHEVVTYDTKPFEWFLEKWNKNEN
jgi:hypothetical protein